MTDELDPNSSVAYIALILLCSRQSILIPELLYHNYSLSGYSGQLQGGASNQHGRSRRRPSREDSSIMKPRSREDATALGK